MPSCLFHLSVSARFGWALTKTRQTTGEKRKEMAGASATARRGGSTMSIPATWHTDDYTERQRMPNRSAPKPVSEAKKAAGAEAVAAGAFAGSSGSVGKLRSIASSTGSTSSAAVLPNPLSFSYLSDDDLPPTKAWKNAAKAATCSSDGRLCRESRDLRCGRRHRVGRTKTSIRSLPSAREKRGPSFWKSRSNDRDCPPNTLPPSADFECG